MFNALNKISAELRGQTLRGQLTRSAIGAIFLKLCAAGFAFAAALLYTRILTPHDYGLYAYVFAWTSVITVLMSLGYPSYLVREFVKQPDSASWLLNWADRRTLVSGVVAALLLFGAQKLAPSPETLALFLLASPFPLITNLSLNRSSLLQAGGHIFASQWPQLAFSPILVLVSLSALWLWVDKITALQLTGIMTFSATTALLINILQTRRLVARPIPPRLGVASTRNALPFMWLGMLFLLNSRIDLILLGIFNSPTEVGVYSVATRAAEVTIFILMATDIVIAPKVTHLYVNGDTKSLQRLLTASARRVLYLTLPLAAVFFTFASPLITLFFGSPYKPGALPWQILTIAQLFNVAAGSTTIILNMTGHERLTGKGVTIGIFVNVILCLALIPRFGSIGAAIATGSSIVVCNVLLWIWIRRELNLRPSCFNA